MNDLIVLTYLLLEDSSDSEAEYDHGDFKLQMNARDDSLTVPLLTFDRELDSEAPHDCVSSHVEHPAQLGICEFTVNGIHSESEFDPSLQTETHQTHGLGGHSNLPEFSEANTHHLELLTSSLETNDISQVSVQIPDGMSGPVSEIDGMSRLTTSVENPQPDVGLEPLELFGGNTPFEQSVKVNPLGFFNVLPTESNLELASPTMNSSALCWTQPNEHVDAFGYPLYQGQFTIPSPAEIRCHSDIQFHSSRCKAIHSLII